MAIEQPSPKRVAENERRFDARDEDYDAAVRLVFERWPDNTKRAEVLVKVVVLNRLYGTNIYSVSPVVGRILELDFDARVRQGDRSLVDELAQIKFRERTRSCVSFASKYCAWHKPESFPMLDSYVESRLWEYQKAFPSFNFRRVELGSYAKYCEVLDNFREQFGLSSCSLRQIDKFLWIEEANLRGDLDANE